MPHHITRPEFIGEDINHGQLKARLSRAWTVGQRAQDRQIQRERAARLPVELPPTHVVDLDIIMSFFRSVEAGEYAVTGWSSRFTSHDFIPDLGKAAWNEWAQVVNRTFGGGGQQSPALVLDWDPYIHKRLLQPTINFPIGWAVEVLELEYLNQESRAAVHA